MAEALNVKIKVLATQITKMTRRFYKDGHKGADLIPNKTTETPAILSYGDGTVIATGNVSGTNKSTGTIGMGTFVAVKHRDGTITRYQHLKYNSLKVVKGEAVKVGQQLAVYGRPTNGNSTGPHLHFDISLSDKPKSGQFIKGTFCGETRYYVDPVPFLEKTGDNLYRCTTNRLRVRKSPSISSPIVDYLSYGETIKATDVQNGFAGFANGWCSMEYLKKV